MPTRVLRTTALTTLALAVGLGSSACAKERGVQGDAGGADDSPTDAGDGDGDGDGDGGVLDVGNGNDAGDDGGLSDECTNVDILFVIDSSGSMADNQASLIASFPGFIAAVKENLAFAESYHVGVVTSDAYAANQMGCRDLGDLVTQTGGPESSSCVGTPFASGKRWMDESEVDLLSKFSCIALVGSGGNDDEKMAGGLLGALDPVNNATGACNDGFSRVDSLLVLVLISDEDDVPEPFGCDPNEVFGDNACDTVGSGGTPAEWSQQVIDWKAGLGENVVVLSLIGGSGNSCGAVISSKLLSFTNDFENSFVGDICATSYDEFFAAALPVVDQACENFVPPG